MPRFRFVFPLNRLISVRRALPVLVLLLALAVIPAGDVLPQADFPPAPIANDEGGPVLITGSVSYSNPFFTDGVAAPVIILEDQAGFVDRNRYYIMPPESQTLGQITSDFYTSPFTYSLALPIEPQGAYRDVDNDGGSDSGIQVFAVAYWENIYGDPFLEARDLAGGGWSTAYASTRTSNDPSSQYEIVGGTFLVYAPDDAQGFPADFGADGRLFTADDPIVGLPQGYTLVNMDARPFSFDRSREVSIDLYEPESAALVDFSGLSYTAAFDAMVEKLRREYAFTEYKGINWDSLYAAYLPLFSVAEQNNDPLAYRLALRDFLWSIPDGHVSGPFDSIIDVYFDEIGGGLGMALRQLDDGTVIVNYLTAGGPAEQAGIQLGAEILALDNLPIGQYLETIRPWTGPFSSEHVRRLNQLLYAVRFPTGTAVNVIYRNPEGDSGMEPVTLTASGDSASFSFAFDDIDGVVEPTDGSELPVEYRLLESGYLYAQVYTFIDNNALTIQLWERMIAYLNDNGIPGLIIDMRQNGGGWGWLADDMAAYFFQQPLVLGNTAIYDEATGSFFVDPRGEQTFELPSPDLRYNGKVAVLVGPGCASACEGFAFNMTLENRAAIVGQYATMGLGGGVREFLMPEDEVIRYTASRSLGPDGTIHLEGIGVTPTVRVPVTRETLFAEGDPILEAAIAHLDTVEQTASIDVGEIRTGEPVLGTLAAGLRFRYTWTAPEDGLYTFTVTDPTGNLDTVLYIYIGGDPTPALSNDDDPEGGTANSALRRVQIPAGVSLVVEVAGFGDSVTGGPYTLTVARTE